MTSPLDEAPPDDLARAFRLPDWVIADPELVALHTAIVRRLRTEAHGMPMNTVQQLLLERIAFNYIVLKHKEETDGFTTPTQQKDFTQWWLAMTQEFNKLLMANQDRMREAMLAQVQDIVKGVIGTVADADERRRLRRELSERFAAADL
jgi:hypothetical protein